MKSREFHREGAKNAKTRGREEKGVGEAVRDGKTILNTKQAPFLSLPRRFLGVLGGSILWKEGSPQRTQRFAEGKGRRRGWEAHLGSELNPSPGSLSFFSFLSFPSFLSSPTSAALRLSSSLQFPSRLRAFAVNSSQGGSGFDAQSSGFDGTSLRSFSQKFHCEGAKNAKGRERKRGGLADLGSQENLIPVSFFPFPFRSSPISAPLRLSSSLRFPSRLRAFAVNPPPQASVPCICR